MIDRIYKEIFSPSTHFQARRLTRLPEVMVVKPQRSLHGGEAKPLIPSVLAKQSRLVSGRNAEQNQQAQVNHSLKRRYPDPW